MKIWFTRSSLRMWRLRNAPLCASGCRTGKILRSDDRKIPSWQPSVPRQEYIAMRKKFCGLPGRRSRSCPRSNRAAGRAEIPRGCTGKAGSVVFRASLRNSAKSGAPDVSFVRCSLPVKVRFFSESTKRGLPPEPHRKEEAHCKMQIDGPRISVYPAGS